MRFLEWQNSKIVALGKVEVFMLMPSAAEINSLIALHNEHRYAEAHYNLGVILNGLRPA